MATTKVTAAFSEAMDLTSLSGSTVTLTQQGITTPVAAAVTYDGPSRTATLAPSARLAAATTYLATVKGGPSGAKDLTGNPLATDRTWSFTTVAPPDTAALMLMISNVQSTGLNSTEAAITWTTNEPVDSEVEYGITAASGSTTMRDSALVTDHAVRITGLVSEATYHCRVQSRDAAGNLAVSGDCTFTMKLL